MVFYSKPSNRMHQKCLVRTLLGDTIKRRYHRAAPYKMELIYTQTKLKGLSSPELALHGRKKDRKKIDSLPFFDLAGSEVYVNFHGCSLAC